MKMFFKTYVSWIYLYQNMDPLLAWGVHKEYDPVVQVSKPDKKKT